MATRLYPKTSDLSIIATILHVSFNDTVLYKLYEKWEERNHKDHVLDEFDGSWLEMFDGSWLKLKEEGDIGYEVYCWLRNTYPNVDKIQHFMLMGWGRVCFPESWIGVVIKDVYEEKDLDNSTLQSPCAGEVTSPELVWELLHETGIYLSNDLIDQLEGVYWE